jgi:hypothetical protein
MEVSTAVTSLLSEVDERTVAVELARLALETAREALENARVALDETLARGDGLGIDKSKLRKLGEDRLLALIALGALPASRGGIMSKAKPVVAPASRRPRRRAAAAMESYMPDDANLIEDVAEVAAPASYEANVIALQVPDVAVIDAGLPEMPDVARVENEVVDASAIVDVLQEAGAELGHDSAASATVIDIGTIDFDALAAGDDMDAAAAAAVMDLSAEEMNPLSVIEAELERAHAALRAA